MGEKFFLRAVIVFLFLQAITSSTHPHINYHVYLDAVQPLLEERQHLRELVVRVHVVHGAAALLQQPDDVLVLDLLVHLELLESGAQ